MKIEAFKKLIKESVREVLKEEGILKENNFQKIDPSKYMVVEQFKTTPYHNSFQPTSTGDPLQDLLKQTMMESNDLSNYQ
jgi:quinol monooxygenase YgiN